MPACQSDDSEPAGRKALHFIPVPRTAVPASCLDISRNHGLIVKGSDSESPVQETLPLLEVSGVSTLTCALLASMTFVAGMTAVNSLAWMTVVCRLPRFRLDDGIQVKKSPLTVRVNCGPPARIAFGDIDEMLGGKKHAFGLLVPQQFRPTTAAAIAPMRLAGVLVKTLFLCILIPFFGTPDSTKHGNE
jgi:hypothetical protein